MRMIGYLENEAKARLFGDFLYAEGVDSQLEFDASEGWAIWVVAEEDIPRATKALETFRTSPEDERYIQARAVAGARREEENRLEQEAEKRHFDRATLFPNRRFAFGWVTLTLIGISVLVGVLSGGALRGNNLNEAIIQPLSFTTYTNDGQMIRWPKGLPELRQGQLWRVITPIFIHFGLMHLLFNMMWLLDLGSLIERRQSPWMLVALVLTIAATSNIAQYAVHQYPAFGGMSGVVYGLLGYIWVRSRLDPTCGLYLQPLTIGTAMVWFFLCLLGVIPHVANTIHVVGLAVGALWGYLTAAWSNRRL